MATLPGSSRVRHGRSTVVCKWSECELLRSDVDLIGRLVEAAGVVGAFDVVAVGGRDAAAIAIDDAAPNRDDAHAIPVAPNSETAGFPDTVLFVSVSARGRRN